MPTNKFDYRKALSTDEADIFKRLKIGQNKKKNKEVYLGIINKYNKI